MGLLKCNLLATTYSAAHTLGTSVATTCTTSLQHRSHSVHAHDHHQPRLLPTRKRRRCHEHIRTYATLTGDQATASSSSSSHSDGSPDETPPWPSPPHGHTQPTPYQILQTTPSASYTKARFYQLVKLYHPDHRTSHTCPAHIALERYRLLVAAHAILSDPGKRRAYDLCGAGWSGRPSTPDFRSWDPSSSAGGPFTSRASRHAAYADGVHRNATWEDWERWHARQDTHAYGAHGANSAPVYVANSTFVGLILLFVAVGGSWNYNRAEHEGERFLASRDAVHDRASKDLRRVRQSVGLRPKDERIDWFVRNREAVMSGGFSEEEEEEIREERTRGMMPVEERCGVDDEEEVEEHGHAR